MGRMLFVGNSHLVALLHAAREASGEPPAPAETSFLWSSEEIHTSLLSVERAGGRIDLAFALLDGGSWQRFAAGPTDQVTVSPAYAEVLLELADGGVDEVVSCLYGNEHSVFSLFEHEMPFDFVFDGIDVDPEAGGRRQILPAEVVRRELADRLAPLVRSCRALRNLFPGVPMRHVMPPPPVADGGLIRARPEALAAVIEARGVAPAPLRLKVYRLAEAIVSEGLEGSGVTMVRAPSAALDDGYLAEAFWMASVHATTTYGGLVLDQLGAR
jgi:hypothetical protein